MRNFIIPVLFYLLGISILQSQEIKTSLPSIIPPSPNVAGLMKFEEIPISNYTGTPDISIPLYSCPTRSKDISIDLSLKYHPASVAYRERASEVGLGWSLFAGGTISRTVRGLPDEVRIITAGSGLYGNGKFGTYQYTFAYNGQEDRFTDVLGFLQNGGQSDDQQGMMNDFFWESLVKDKFDTQYDLWQFNFMGHIGRFYIQKKQTEELEVVPLDDYRLKVIVNYALSTNGFNHLVPTGFTVYDEKGFKFIFTDIEFTHSATDTQNTYNLNGMWQTTPHSDLPSFPSAFQLSQIFDPAGNLLAEFEYGDFPEVVRDMSRINNKFDKSIVLPYVEPSLPSTSVCPYGGRNELMRLGPDQSIISTLNSIQTKKVSKITIKGFGTVEFQRSVGRNDSNIQLRESACILTGIKIKDLTGADVKTIAFNHGYKHVIDDRLILTAMRDINPQNTDDFEETEFSYVSNDVGSNYIYKDYWGYFNLMSSCAILTPLRETTPQFCTSDLLQKIKYSTGGCTIFDFEANQYSFIGDEPIADFSENPDNYNVVSDFQNLSTANNPDPGIYPNGNTYNLTFFPNQDVKIKIYPPNLGENSGMKIFKDGVGQVGNFNCPDSHPNCCIDYTLEAGHQYCLKLFTLNAGQVVSGTVNIEYHLWKNFEISQKLYGGGNRIKRVGYFSQDLPQTHYYDNDGFTPIKELNYIYSFFDDPQKSSGSLVFPKPVFHYLHTESPCFDCVIVISTEQIETETTFDNLLAVHTQGAEIGYKNVSVVETGKGKTQFTYTSPIDFPEESVSLSPPYFPSENKDYKRGLLETELISDESGRKLKKTKTNFAFEEFQSITGLKLFRANNCTGADLYSSYVFYHDMPNICESNFEFNCVIGGFTYQGQTNPQYPLCPCFCYCGEVPNFIHEGLLYEYYGWAKPIDKITEQYFYDQNVQHTIQNTENFDYNDLNKQISEYTIKNSRGQEIKTNYFYHTGNSDVSQNRISELQRIEVRTDSNLTSVQNIQYDNNFPNHAWRPVAIQSMKGQTTLEDRVLIGKYDDFGHELQVSQSNGIPISYIYGYNNSMPIAKLEGIAYDQINAAIISNLQSLSDQDNDHCNTVGCHEENLRIALQALRVSYPNAMVTSYTYDPLVGVTSETDPKGQTTYYEYDGFGRLKSVRDKDHNLLSENQYHYKN